MNPVEPRRWPYPAMALALVMALTFAQAAHAGALTVPDLVSLLRAGVGEKVILAQVRATGALAPLEAREILQLKQAGASDVLLEALLGDGAGSSPAPATAGGLRVYRAVGPDGKETLHVTNLDEAGRRLGGELPPGPANRSTDTPAATLADRGYREETGGDAPIVVNVYPPAPAAPDGSNGGYDDGAIIRQGGVYTGYLALGGGGYCGSCPRRGHHDDGHGHDGHDGRRRPAFVEDGGLFSRPPAIDTRPYRIGTAAQRNRARFGN